MRLTLWQQFSSNHSASYTVVGEFQSTEAAQEAVDVIRRIMREAAKWCFDNREDCYQLKEPTPVEKQYGLQYGFDWKERIDWLRYSHERSIHNVEYLVVINTRYVDTYQTGHQFVNLMSAMGANVAQDVMDGVDPDNQEAVWMGMGFELRCEMESPESAANLVTKLASLFESMRNFRVSYHIPWLIFHPQFGGITSDRIIELDAHYLKDEKWVRAIRKWLPILSNKLVHVLWNKVRTLPNDEWVQISQRRRELQISCKVVMQEANALVFEGLSFSDIHIGLPAFIRYLEHSGCLNIAYTIHQLY